MPVSEVTRKMKNKAKASLTLLLVAVISITTATYAWFTLSNSTSVQSMEVKVGTGTKLMVSTSDSGTVSDPWNGYVSELTTEMVNDALNKAHSYRLDDIRLWPLTSTNGVDLKTQGSTAVMADTKYYLELELWFRSSVDMNVYLNGAPSETGKDDGTKVWSHTDNNTSQSPVDHAVRLSLTEDGSGTGVIYEPNKEGATPGQTTFDALGDNTGSTGSETVFTLTADTPKKVTVRLWIEGQDPQCVNGNGEGADKDVNLEKARLLTQLRLCGADNSGKFIETTVT